jgi:hypothetical protein
VETTHTQYDQVIESCRSTFRLKTRDYGTAWRILRPSSLTDQIYIKASRLRSIQEKGQMKVEESMEEAFQAIVNYSIMAMIQLEIIAEEDKYEMPPEEALAVYDKFVSETRELMMKKNHDYGEAWRDMRISSITDLILMKLLRIKQIEENDGQTLISEGLKSNYQDILNYAVFALILLSEKNN